MNSQELLECPCCKGEKHLLVYDDNWPEDAPHRLQCTHCEGIGVIAMDTLSVKARLPNV